MKKNNIEKDLLDILKSKKSEDLIHDLLCMLHGIYNYEYDYLNDIPFNVMIIYLEKIMVLGTDWDKPLDDIENARLLLIKFIVKINDIDYQKIKKKSFKAFEYDHKIKKERKKEDNHLNKRIAAFILAGIIFISLYSMEMDNLLLDSFEGEKGYIHKDVSKNEFREETITNITRLESETDIEKILRLYKLNEQEFNTLVAIVLSEAKSGSYTDAYAVINTIYNRTKSKFWNRFVSNYHGYTTDSTVIYDTEVTIKEAGGLEKDYLKRSSGTTLYDQATMKGQFVVYEQGLYKKNLNVREGAAYQAIIDFLLTEEVMHDYLSFRSNGSEVEEFEQFTEGGNKYFEPLLINDRIIEEENMKR